MAAWRRPAASCGNERSATRSGSGNGTATAVEGEQHRSACFCDERRLCHARDPPAQHSVQSIVSSTLQRHDHEQHRPWRSKRSIDDVRTSTCTAPPSSTSALSRRSVCSVRCRCCHRSLVVRTCRWICVCLRQPRRCALSLEHVNADGRVALRNRTCQRSSLMKMRMASSFCPGGESAVATRRWLVTFGTKWAELLIRGRAPIRHIYDFFFVPNNKELARLIG